MKRIKKDGYYHSRHYGNLGMLRCELCGWEGYSSELVSRRRGRIIYPNVCPSCEENDEFQPFHYTYE